MTYSIYIPKNVQLIDNKLQDAFMFVVNLKVGVTLK